MREDLQPLLRSIEWHFGFQDETGSRVSFQVWYHLSIGAPGRREIQIQWESQSEGVKRRFAQLANWAVGQMPPPDAYEVLGRLVHPTPSLDVLHFAVYGQTENPANTLSVSTFVNHPDWKEGGPHYTWSEAELPPEVQELARSYDELAWEAVRQRILTQFSDEGERVPASPPPMVYVAYRDANLASIQSAQRLSSFLIRRGLRAFFAPWRIGWGDSLFGRLDSGMGAADAAVLCFTSDFLEGDTAQKEYTFFVDRLVGHPEFKAGLLLIGVRYDDAPGPFQDILNARIDDPDDPDFEIHAERILRGVLGLGQEPLWGTRQDQRLCQRAIGPADPSVQ